MAKRRDRVAFASHRTIDGARALRIKAGLEAGSYAKPEAFTSMSMKTNSNGLRLMTSCSTPA